MIAELETEEELVLVTGVQEEVVNEVDKDVLDQFLVDTTQLIVSQRLDNRDSSEVGTEVESCVSYVMYKQYSSNMNNYFPANAENRCICTSKRSNVLVHSKIIN